MGQYYKPVCIEKNEYLYSHDYDNGLKLMEHSWIGNNFMDAVMTLIKPKGLWYRQQIVWAGDYADPEKDENGEDMVSIEGYDINLYDIVGKDGTKLNVKPDKELGRFLVNMDTKEFVGAK